eukprot:8346270-Pyramimonas_sp.AAC.1
MSCNWASWDASQSAALLPLMATKSSGLSACSSSRWALVLWRLIQPTEISAERGVTQGCLGVKASPDHRLVVYCHRTGQSTFCVDGSYH